jgi:uncharacterized protein (TIGR02301 family)
MARRLYGFGTRSIIGVALALALMGAATPSRAGDLDSGLDKGLVRLAEILGSVHHLREVCGANEGALWRNKMIDMLNAATLGAQERQLMISHFNDAYYQAQKAFPDCSDGAAQASNSLFDEAHKLAARLAGTDRSAAAGF